MEKAVKRAFCLTRKKEKYAVLGVFPANLQLCESFQGKKCNKLEHSIIDYYVTSRAQTISRSVQHNRRNEASESVQAT